MGRPAQKPWQYDLPQDFRERLIKAIVGVKLTVRAWQGKFKLSQNRDQEDYEAVINEFENRHDENSRELLRYFKLANTHKS